MSTYQRLHLVASLRAAGVLALAALVGVVGLLVGSVPASAADEPVTYQGPLYPSTAKNPTADKPQSKLWYADGSWWGLLVASDTYVHIHELMPDHTWRDTGTIVDRRPNSTGDALWDGSKLYVASRHASTPLEVSRFSYDGTRRTWALDSGFPETLATGGGSESASIDLDSKGRLWVTYTRARKVWVAHSTADHHTWTSPFTPAVPDVSIYADDISAIVAFQGRIGVMWSDQGNSVFRFAVHRDDAPDSSWTLETALAGVDLADDHINLKQLSTDSQGRLFAAIKTGLDAAGPDAMLTGVLVRKPAADGSGVWSVVPAGTVADDHTRPILMIDETNRHLYFIATGSVSGGTIYYKRTSLDDPAFAAGRGAPLVRWGTVSLNNATSTKQAVNADSGLVVLAAGDGKKRYFHAEMALGSTTQPSPTATTTATPTPTTSPTSSPTTSTSSSTSTSTSPQGPIDVVDVTSAGTAESTSISVPSPATAAGDVLLAGLAVRGAPTITPPAGWTLVRLTPNGTAMQLATYVRTAGSAEPASHRWTFNKAQSATAAIAAYRGVATGAPVESSNGVAATTASTSVVAPSVTVSTPGARVVGVFGTTALTAFTPPPGMTERADQAVPSTATYKISSELADLTVAAPGETGDKTATSAVQGRNAGQLVVLRPAP